MNRVLEQIGDAETLLAMEPEELAGRMLLDLAREQGTMGFHRDNYCSNVRHSRLSETFVNQEEDVLQAAVEAFVWLENTGLVIPKSGSGTWSIVSRRGMQLLETGSFEDFTTSLHYPKALIHSSIRDTVWRTFIRRDYDTAVFQAMKAVEVAVREASSASHKSIVVNLAREAFHTTKGPLSDLETHEAEREAVCALFVGALGSYKNPHSHRNVSLNDPKEAIEIIMLASHLLRIVDGRRSERKGGTA